MLSEVAQVVVAVGQLITIIMLAYSTIVSQRNGRKADTLTAKVDAGVAKVDAGNAGIATLTEQTNGMSKELVHAKEIIAEAVGVAKERALVSKEAGIKEAAKLEERADVAARKEEQNKPPQ